MLNDDKNDYNNATGDAFRARNATRIDFFPLPTHLSTFDLEFRLKIYLKLVSHCVHHLKFYYATESRCQSVSGNNTLLC